MMLNCSQAIDVAKEQALKKEKVAADHAGEAGAERRSHTCAERMS